jgi:hypothetical protein
MPYIKKCERRLAAENPINPGELNYALTKVALEYLDEFPLNYAKLNEIVGAFDLAKAEFIRRVVAPYEDKKRDENGDVYPERG